MAREHGWDGMGPKAHDRAWGFSGSHRTSHELVPSPMQFLWVVMVPFGGNVSEPVHIQCMCVVGWPDRSGRQLKQPCSWSLGSVCWFWHLEGQINCPSFSLAIASRAQAGTGATQSLSSPHAASELYLRFSHFQHSPLSLISYCCANRMLQG